MQIGLVCKQQQQLMDRLYQRARRGLHDGAWDLDCALVHVSCLALTD